MGDKRDVVWNHPKAPIPAAVAKSNAAPKKQKVGLGGLSAPAWAGGSGACSADDGVASTEAAGARVVTSDDPSGFPLSANLNHVSATENKAPPPPLKLTLAAFLSCRPDRSFKKHRQVLRTSGEEGAKHAISGARDGRGRNVGLRARNKYAECEERMGRLLVNMLLA